MGFQFAPPCPSSPFGGVIGAISVRVACVMLLGSLCGCSIEPRIDLEAKLRRAPPSLLAKLEGVAVAGRSRVLTPELCGAIPPNTIAYYDAVTAVPIDPWLPFSGQRRQITQSINGITASPPGGEMQPFDLAAITPRDRLTYRIGIPSTGDSARDYLLFGWPDCPVRIVVSHYSIADLDAAGVDTALWNAAISSPDRADFGSMTDQPLPTTPTTSVTRSIDFPPFGPRLREDVIRGKDPSIEFHRAPRVSVKRFTTRDGATVNPEEHLAPGEMVMQTSGMPHDGPWSRMIRVPAGRPIDTAVDLRRWFRFGRPGLYVMGLTYHQITLNGFLDDQLAETPVSPMAMVLSRDPSIAAESVIDPSDNLPLYLLRQKYATPFVAVFARYIPSDSFRPEVQDGLPRVESMLLERFDRESRYAEWRNGHDFPPRRVPQGMSMP